MANFDLSFSFYLQNNKGDDLLEPGSSTAYKRNEIKLFKDPELKEDVTREYTPNGEEDLVHGPHEKGYMLFIFPNMSTPISGGNFENILYLQLAESDVDTLNIQVTEMNNGAYISKFVYNETIIFDFNDAQFDFNWNKVIVK